MTKDTSHYRCSQESDVCKEQWLSVLSLYRRVTGDVHMGEEDEGRPGRDGQGQECVCHLSRSTSFPGEGRSNVWFPFGRAADRSEWGLSSPGDRTDDKA